MDSLIQDAHTRNDHNETREDIRFALKWSDGHKLFGVKHVKGPAWKHLSVKSSDACSANVAGGSHAPHAQDDIGGNFTPDRIAANEDWYATPEFNSKTNNQ